MDRTDSTQNFKKFFLKLTPIFFLFISYRSLFITTQNKKNKKKSLLNKKFHFFYTKYIYIFFLTSIKFVMVPVNFLKSSPLLNIAKNTGRKKHNKLIRLTHITCTWKIPMGKFTYINLWNRFKWSLLHMTFFDL